MNELVTYKGIIHFDPVNFTKKQTDQSSWKRVAMVMFDGEMTEYYAWFIKKRYDLVLNKPLRGGHVSFINDSLNDMKIGLNTEEEDYIETIWNNTKAKWDNKELEITLNVNARSNSNHWWLNIPNEHRSELHAIRAELGLGRSYYDLHMSIGTVHPRYTEHSKYILDLINKGFIE